MTGRAIQVSILFVVCLGLGHSVDVTGETKDAAQKPFLASVREKPEHLHKCMATFLSPTALVASATCLLCGDYSNMFIMVVKDRLRDPTAPIYNVREVVTHPNYTGKSVKYDIGIILLEKPASDVRIIDLPSSFYYYCGVGATTYEWLFSTNEMGYTLKEQGVTTVCSNVCSSILTHFVSDQYVCAHANNKLHMGPYDHASPVISDGTYILGIFPFYRVSWRFNAVQYESIFPHIQWIEDVIKDNSVH